MSRFEDGSHTVARSSGATGLRDRLLDAVLPHRGAIANARAAVERDRVAASQRQQVPLGMAARVSGHPAGSGSPRGAR